MLCPICDGAVIEWIDDGYSNRVCIEGHFEVRQGFLGAHIRYEEHNFFLNGGRENRFSYSRSGKSSMVQ